MFIVLNRNNLITLSLLLWNLNRESKDGVYKLVKQKMKFD